MLLICSGWTQPTHKMQHPLPLVLLEEAVPLALEFRPKSRLSLPIPRSSSPTSDLDLLVAQVAIPVRRAVRQPRDQVPPALAVLPARPRRTSDNVVELATLVRHNAPAALLARSWTHSTLNACKVPWERLKVPSLWSIASSVALKIEFIVSIPDANNTRSFYFGGTSFAYFCNGCTLTWQK
jgi:hypothetical protein